MGFCSRIVAGHTDEPETDRPPGPRDLRASHIKPWATRAGDAERLDVYNGLLLAAHLDAAFDAELMTVADDGQVLLSRRMSVEARRCLGLPEAIRTERRAPHPRRYLSWHREREFKT